MNDIGKLWQPIVVIAAAVGTFLLVWSVADRVALATMGQAFLDLGAEASPGGIKGGDLLADLLTVSALTITVCISYLCLPTDRVEVRISSYVQYTLLRDLIEPEDFHEFYDTLAQSEITPACKAIRGLLNPRSGLGGWHRIEEAEMETIFGAPTWERFRVFVNDHVADTWVKILIGGLGVGMAAGVYSLALRYLGLTTRHFSAFELGVIFALTVMNIGAVVLVIRLFSGGRIGERSVRDRIDSYVAELKPRIQAQKAQRRDSKMAEIERATSRLGS